MNTEDKSKWLNEWGLLIWKNKEHPHLEAERAYHWCDRVLFTGKERRVLADLTYTEMKDVLERDWMLMTKEEYNKEISSAFKYGAEEIRQAGKDGELNHHDIEHLISVLIENRNKPKTE